VTIQRESLPEVKKGKTQCKLAISQLAMHLGHLNPVFRSTAPQTPDTTLWKVFSSVSATQYAAATLLQ
jgi:hypothetical protein